MKLPALTSRREVQSLGRQDVLGPMRVANARAQAAQYTGAPYGALADMFAGLRDTTKTIADQQAVQEYNHAWANLQYDAAIAEAEVNANPMLSIASTPELEHMQVNNQISVVTSNADGTESVDLPEVPTWEYGPSVLNARLDNLYQAAFDNIKSGSARQKLAADWVKLRATMEAAQIAKSTEQRTAYEEARIRQTVDTYVGTGDEESAKVAVQQAVESMLITPDIGVELWADIEKGIDQNKILYIIINGDEDEIASATLEIVNARMSFDDKKALLGDLQAAQDKRIAEEEKELEEEQEAYAAMVMAEVSEGRWTVEDVNDNSHMMSLTDYRTALTLARTMANEDEDDIFPDEDTLGEYWASEIYGLQFSSTGLDPYGGRVEKFRLAMLEALSGRVSHTTLQNLMGQLDRAQKAPYSSTQYDRVTDSMSHLITGAGKNSLALNQDKELVARYEAALAELHRKLDAEGPQFDIQGWWNQNRNTYMTAQARTSIGEIENLAFLQNAGISGAGVQLLSDNLVRSNGEYDFDATWDKLNAEQIGRVELYLKLLRTEDRTSAQDVQLEEAELRKQDGEAALAALDELKGLLND